MSRITKAWNALAKTAVKPLTKIFVGGNKIPNLFEDRGRNTELLKKYETIYRQGGVISELIDCYAVYALSSGWRLEGKDIYVNQVEQFLEKLNFRRLLWNAIIDTLVFGDSFQELVYTRGREIEKIVSCPTRTIEIDHDEYRTINGYRQIISTYFGLEYTIDVPVDNIIHTQFLSIGGDMYGISVIGRAYDDIMRDTKIAESIAVAIERHGFRKYHIRVGSEGEDVPESILTEIDRKFQELETKNEIATTHDVEINPLDKEGLANLDVYNDVSLERVASSIGVPEELAGLRRGSTDATAVSRIDVFLKKVCSFIQQELSRSYELGLFDRITKPGEVKLVFNDINPKDEAEKAKWIAEIMKSTPLDPFIVLPQEWIKEQFNIDPDAYNDEEDEYRIEETEEDAETEKDQQDDSEGTDTDEDTAETV